MFTVIKGPQMYISLLKKGKTTTATILLIKIRVIAKLHDSVMPIYSISMDQNITEEKIRNEI